MASPETPGRVPPPVDKSTPHRQPSYGLDDNPYGGIDSGPQALDPNVYGEYGGVRGPQLPPLHHLREGGETLWHGPTEQALREQNRQSDGIEYAQARIASMYGARPAVNTGSGTATPPAVSFAPGSAATPVNPHQHNAGMDHDYEYAQQAELDAQAEHPEQEAWKDAPTGHLPPGQTPVVADAAVSPPWQPLNVRREKSPGPEATTLHEGNGSTSRPQSNHDTSAPAVAPPAAAPFTGNNTALVPPLSVSAAMQPAPRNTASPALGSEGFHTPQESMDQFPSTNGDQRNSNPPIIPLPMGLSDPPPLSAVGASTPLNSIPAPPASPRISTDVPSSSSQVTPGGKMSAGAFRKAVPRRSDLGVEDGPSPQRRLPAPPSGAPAADTASQWPNEKQQHVDMPESNAGGPSYPDAPPQYGDHSNGQNQGMR